MTFAPGLRDVVAAEIVERWAPPRPPRPVAGRDDALAVDLLGWDRRVLGLRTAAAVWTWQHHDVPRPRALTSGDHQAPVLAAIRAALAVAPCTTLRVEAAGADSPVLRRLADDLAATTGLRVDPDDGELVVKVRRGVRRGATDPGWAVLVRTGPRPLSARRWRVVDYPGAANAAVAAAMVRLAGVRADQRVAALMCGSGTLLIERLLAGPAAAALGVDLDATALEAAGANLAAAGLTATLLCADVLGVDAPAALLGADALAAPGGRAFDLVLADPPWGTLHGSHAQAQAVHEGLLRTAHAITAENAVLAVLTHEVRVMERVVAASTLWRPDPPVTVFAKGHHPRIWVLHRVPDARTEPRTAESGA